MNAITLRLCSDTDGPVVYVGDGSADAAGGLVDVRIVDGSETLVAEADIEHLLREAICASLNMRETEESVQEIRSLVLKVLDEATAPGG